MVMVNTDESWRQLGVHECRNLVYIQLQLMTGRSVAHDVRLTLHVAVEILHSPPPSLRNVEIYMFPMIPIAGTSEAHVPLEELDWGSLDECLCGREYPEVTATVNFSMIAQFVEKDARLAPALAFADSLGERLPTLTARRRLKIVKAVAQDRPHWHGRQ